MKLTALATPIQRTSRPCGGWSLAGWVSVFVGRFSAVVGSIVLDSILLVFRRFRNRLDVRLDLHRIAIGLTAVHLVTKPFRSDGDLSKPIPVT